MSSLHTLAGLETVASHVGSAISLDQHQRTEEAFVLYLKNNRVLQSSTALDATLLIGVLCAQDNPVLCQMPDSWITVGAPPLFENNVVLSTQCDPAPIGSTLQWLTFSGLGVGVLLLIVGICICAKMWKQPDKGGKAEHLLLDVTEGDEDPQLASIKMTVDMQDVRIIKSVGSGVSVR
jgi:hypothetical protein